MSRGSPARRALRLVATAAACAIAILGVLWSVREIGGAVRSSRGVRALSEGRLVAAARDLRGSIRLRPGDPRTLSALGEAYRLLALRDRDRAAAWRERALECYAAAIDRSPSDAKPWLHLGRLLAEAGNDPASERALARAAALGPRDAEVLEAHGTALARLGRNDEAIRRFAAAYPALSEATRERDTARLIRRAVRAAPDAAGLRPLWGEGGFDPWPAGLYLRREGALEAAQAALDAAARARPEDPARLEAWTQVALARRDLPSAETGLRRLASTRATPADQERLAGFLRDTGRGDEAGAILDRMCGEGECAPSAFLLQALLARDAGNLEGAREALGRGLAAHPLDARLRSELDRVERALFDRRQAEIERRFSR